MVRITHRKRGRKTHKTRRHQKIHRRKRQHKRRQSKRRTRVSKKQRGGFNKTKYGNTNYFSIDNRYRPAGGIADSISYYGKSLMNNIQGNYKPVNPNVSNQPIGKPLSAKNLKFGVGSTGNSQALFNEAALRSSAFPNSPNLK